MSGSQLPVMQIEVAFALLDRQWISTLTVPVGCTAAQAVARSGLADAFPDHTIDGAPLGVFGHRVPPDFELAAGDRVEVYRPLKADPKAVRRKRAAQGETMSGDAALPRGRRNR